MIEAIVSLVTAVVEAVVAVVSALVELVVGAVSVGGESLTFGELIVLLLAIILEWILWMLLLIKELVVALFKWRKPRKVARPLIYKREERLKR